MKKLRIFTLILLIAIGPQCKSQEHNSGKSWSFRFQAGAGSFMSSGIPKSRNQLNYEQISSGSKPTYMQESRNVGFCYEAGLYRSLGNRLRIGIVSNFFRDDDEYFGQTDLNANIGIIQADSLTRQSVLNLQSYADVGVGVEYDFIYKENSRHLLSLGINTGPCINRTPERTEYDVFAENHFIQAPISSNMDTWYIISTKFHNGWFVMPYAFYGFKINNGQLLSFSISATQHWLSTSYNTQILSVNSSGSANQNLYSVFSIQLKLGYSLSF